MRKVKAKTRQVAKTKDLSDCDDVSSFNTELQHRVFRFQQISVVKLSVWCNRDCYLKFGTQDGGKNF